MYKASELREKSREELLQLVSELKGKLLALRFESATGQLQETHLPKATRKDIALVFTVLKEKEQGIVIESKPETAKPVSTPTVEEVKVEETKAEEAVEEVVVEEAAAPVVEETTTETTEEVVEEATTEEVKEEVAEEATPAENNEAEGEAN